MTIEAGLTQLQVDVAELADESQSLAKSVTSSLAEIDAVKGDIQNTHNFVDSNYQAMNDWQTKHGTVTFKNLQGQNKQVNTLSKLILDSEKINPNPHVMSKAQFDALRELRKQQYAGSGFVEWGKHWAGSGADGTVNEGLWPYFKEMRWGRRNNVSDAGSSHAGFPIAVIDGVSHNIKGTALNATEAANNIQIQFPPAPDGTKTYDSATGVVTEHASAAKAFEGVVTNGDFRNGTTGWGFGPSWAVVDGNAVHTSGAGTQIVNSLSLTVGVEYEATFVFSGFVASSSPNTQFQIRKGDGSNSHMFFDVDKSGLSRGTIKLKWTATEANPLLRVYSTDAITIHSTEFKPVTESVITSRKDLVFLESWHEKISDKDVVYPLGNVQYGGTTFDGMTMDLSPSGIAQGYSAFGEWDTATNGRGHRWTTLIDSEKKKFIDNPENNIYYDSEADELIQVRYRVRVVEGKGDNWDMNTVHPNKNSTIFGYRFGANIERIHVRGSTITPYDFTIDGSNFFHNKKWNQPTTTNTADIDPNIWTQRTKGQLVSHGETARAIPIALVQRMNQGAYHSTYNPMGCKGFWNSNGTNSWRHSWYVNVAKTPLSIADCFSSSSTNLSGATSHPFVADGVIRTDGSIASGSSGRSDQYKYYDAIYAGQVEDLRLNANKLDVNQLREDSIRKAVAGEMRGKGKVPYLPPSSTYTTRDNLDTNLSNIYLGLDFTIVRGTYGSVVDGQTTVYFHNDSNSTPLYVLPNTILKITCVDFAGGGSTGRYVSFVVDGTNYDSQTTGTIGVDSELSLSSGKLEQITINNNLGAMRIEIVSGGIYEMVSSEFDSLPWVDIIGDPERISATFPDGVVGQWVPQVPVDSVSQQFPFNRKNIQSDYTRTYTFDDGASWTNNTHTTQETINRTDATFPDSRYVSLLHYESPSNFTEPSNSSVVIGDVGDVWAGNDARVEFGNRVQGSLSGEVGTTVAYTTNRNTPIDGYSVWSTGSVLMPDEYPSHICLPSLGGADGNMGVKALSTVTEKDGLLYLQLHGAELKHQPLGAMHTINAGVAFDHTKGELAILQGFDSANFNVPVIFLNDKAMTLNKTSFNGATIKSDGTIIWKNGSIDTNLRVVTSSTAWGDDQVIPIVHGENVKTDLNGNSVKVFCHHTQIPLGIASN